MFLLVERARQIAIGEDSVVANVCALLAFPCCVCRGVGFAAIEG